MTRVKRTRRPKAKTHYVVLWWMSQTPYVAVFENEMAAEIAANVRNALIVAVTGRDVRIESVVDWYRRDEDGRPMPAEWRDLVGHIRTPWTAKTPIESEAAAAV